MTKWTTFELQVVTPLFSGDDQTSPESLIRVPSIRGALRYWFRAVATGHGVEDLSTLAKQESEVFGDTHNPSPIRMRVSRQPPVKGKRQPGWTNLRGGRGNGLRYLLGQGLWKNGTGLLRPFVAPGGKFDLGVRLSDDEQVNSRFLLAMWAWLNYGGLGSRVRRGFGQLQCVKVANLTGDPLIKAMAEQRDWNVLGEVAIPSELRDEHRTGWSTWLREAAARSDAMPERPMLAPKWWGGVLLEERCQTWAEALDLAGQMWRDFRLGPKNKSARVPAVCTPEWADFFNKKRNDYPIGALGLPVGYYAKGGGRVRSGTVSAEDEGGEQLRRASPVWLRPVRLPTSEWGIFTHIFYARLLPKNARLVGKGVAGNHQLDLPSVELAESQWDHWLDGERRLDS
ncbi:type III-B CRISPR module RAMP protein Cmr1 [Saccharopolyspora sp. NPDC000359]|uniref:type III-B CRISPR module RAMP protein Cmr1 n=1 Tax=Saccharopolyspora sp. NPDC000359 TaxID=3154251 RepID=UPI0033242D5A